MDKIVLKAYGKINIGLDVLGKRTDGYHELRMIMQTVGIYDTVKITKRLLKDGDARIIVSTSSDALPNDANNLAYKAAKLLLDEFEEEAAGHGVSIEIDKVIPIAGGMAGGSADCAAVLKGVNELFSLGLCEQELMDRGVKLGADVPYCIMGGTALAEGIGEILTRLSDIPQAYVVIAKPGISVSTGYVYGAIDEIDIVDHPDTEAIIRAINNRDIYELAGSMRNVLEDVTVNEYPVISSLKDMMINEGAVGAMMSGSGPTVFGIFDDRQKAADAGRVIEESGLAAQLYITDFQN